MLITEHIESLLYRYDCVILPKFGAFLAQRVPAEINASTHTFYPPKKVISFNRQLRENDGLLANQLVKSEEITYALALQKIQFFVQSLNRALTTGEEVHIGTTGYFYAQADKILFQASQHNYLLDAFGTTHFTAKAILREEGKEKALLPQKTAAPSILEQKETLVDHESSQPRILGKSPQKHFASYWKYAAVGLVALGIGSTLTLGWYSNQVKAHNIAVQQKAERQIENRIQQATFIIDEPLPLHTFNINIPKASGDYHIVAGAFRDKSNAQKRIQQLKEEGYQPKYIGANQYGLHQVVYQSFSNRTEALDALRTIRKENQDAWLLIKTL